MPWQRAITFGVLAVVSFVLLISSSVASVCPQRQAVEKVPDSVMLWHPVVVGWMKPTGGLFAIDYRRRAG